MTNKLNVASLLIIIGAFFSCQESANSNQTAQSTIKKDTIKADNDTTITISNPPETTCNNDSLNALANIIAGTTDSSYVKYKYILQKSDFKHFQQNFDKRWHSFDSSRLENLRTFKTNELNKIVKTQHTLFYPFSGPDILHAQTFFPEANKYVMLGLEPIGSLPNFNIEEKDSLKKYFSKINTSLHAILKFSFFRTASMSQDLKNTEVDGTLHLLFLFLKRTGNSICSATPIYIDSLGNTVTLNSFSDLKKLKANNRGVEIKFSDKSLQPKTLYYFSLNAADGGLKSNKGFVSYLKNMGEVNTYLKGASYLMHKDYFSVIRNVILTQSKQVIQDDSGIALHYFTENSPQWQFNFYGQYTRPIPMFSAFYQADLDSLYKKQGSKNIGFGIGYNFRDKNSNFMIATKN